MFKENNQSIPSCCNCKLKDGESPQPTKNRGCSHAKEELQHRKNQHIKPKIIREDFLSPLCNSMESKQPSEIQKEPAGSQKKQVANKESGQSM
jgi:hypothetical protein